MFQSVVTKFPVYLVRIKVKVMFQYDPAKLFHLFPGVQVSRRIVGIANDDALWLKSAINARARPDYVLCGSDTCRILKPVAETRQPLVYRWKKRCKIKR